MSFYNFSDAEPESGGSFELIPDGTELDVLVNVQPNDDGNPDGTVTYSGVNGDRTVVPFKFTVVGGDYDKRRFWDSVPLTGSEKAVKFGRSRLRSIIEAVRNIDPLDKSEEAFEKRGVESFFDLDGGEMRVRVKIDTYTNASGETR